MVTLSLLLVLGLLIGSYFIFIRKDGAETSDTLPPISADIPLYYPTSASLPANIKVLEESINTSQGFATYTLKNDSGQELTITQQKKPDTSKVLPFRIIKEFDTDIGKGYIYDNGTGVDNYLVETDTTWILFNGTGLNESSINDTLSILVRV